MGGRYTVLWKNDVERLAKFIKPFIKSERIRKGKTTKGGVSIEEVINALDAYGLLNRAKCAGKI